MVRVIFRDNRKEILDCLSLLFLDIHHLELIISNNIIDNRVHQYQSLDLIPNKKRTGNREKKEIRCSLTRNVE